MSLHWDAAHRLARQVGKVTTRDEKRFVVKHLISRMKLALEESCAKELSAGSGNPSTVSPCDPPKQRGADPVRREAWSPCAASAPRD